jgi:hypothetical protein
MARSLDRRHLHLWAGVGSPLQIKHRLSSDEHTSLLHHPVYFDSLHRKNDFIAEGVHTVFGVKDGEAQLQAFHFPADQFTPVAAKEWLQECGLEPLLFTEPTESRDTPMVEFSVDGRVSTSR